MGIKWLTAYCHCFKPMEDEKEREREKEKEEESGWMVYRVQMIRNENTRKGGAVRSLPTSCPTFPIPCRHADTLRKQAPPRPPDARLPVRPEDKFPPHLELLSFQEMPVCLKIAGLQGAGAKTD